MANSQVPALSDQVVETLVQKVKLPAFLQKLAHDWNINPQSQADIDHLVELGSMLKARKQEEMAKQASQGNPFLASAVAGLRQAVGMGHDAGFAANDNLLKEAAFLKTQESDVAHAALAYATYLQEAEKAAR